jgi:hypothetical protein
LTVALIAIAVCYFGGGCGVSDGGFGVSGDRSN